MGSLFDLAKLWRLLVSIFCSIISIQAHASPEAALIWLKGQQVADGSYRSSAALADPVQSTVEVLIALNQYKALDSPAKNNALDFLLHQSNKNLESNVNALRINKALSANLPIEPIKNYAAYSGGFGDYPGYDDSVFATAQLLSAINDVTTLSEFDASVAIGFILAKQHSDKSWSEESNNSSIVVTAQVNRALQKHRLAFNVNDKISSSLQYLVQAQSATGELNSVLEVAQVLLSIIPVATSPSVYEKATQFLTNSQLVNGSWNNDPYSTALALQVLYLLKNSPSIENKELGSIAGTVKSETTGLTVATARIDIAGLGVRQVNSSADGHFSVLNMPAGEYLITVTATGYQQFSTRLTLLPSVPFDMGNINLKASVNAGLMHGQVIDASTGVPLSNVDLVFIGPKKYFAVTDANGFYSQEVDAGSYGVGFALPGYQPITKNLSVSKSAQTEFSPQLRKLSDSSLQEGFLYGTVYDPTAFSGNMPLSFGKGISGATVQEVIGGVSVQTDVDGNFKIPVASGLIKLVIQQQGFETHVLDGVYVGGDDVNAGMIKLRSITNKLYGKIVDAKTGDAIPLATIEVESKTANSDVNGFYQLTGIEGDKMTAIVSAPGYEVTVFEVTPPKNDIARHDLPIKKLKPSKADILDFASSKENLNAFDIVRFSGFIKNLSVEADKFVIQAHILGADNQLIREITIPNPLSGDSYTFALAPDETNEIEFKWSVDALPPGQYAVKVIVYSAEAYQVLTEKIVYLKIEPTKAASVVGSATPRFSYLNAESTVSLNVDITNRSNIAYELPINFKWLSPEGTILDHGSQSFHLTPDNYQQSVTLKTFAHKFSNSGDYTLVLTVDNVPDVTIGTIINPITSIAPSVRIEPTVDVSPTIITPDGDKKIKVTFKLKGIEENE